MLVEIHLTFDMKVSIKTKMDRFKPMPFHALRASNHRVCLSQIRRSYVQVSSESEDVNDSLKRYP